MKNIQERKKYNHKKDHEKCIFFVCFVVFVVFVVILSCTTNGASTGVSDGVSSPVPGVWTFDSPSDIKNWSAAPNEFYQYTGSVSLKHDTKIAGKGNGALRLDLDFSGPANQNDWSEPKFRVAITPALNLSGFTELEFEFYFKPANRTKGAFQAKVSAPGGLEAVGRIPSAAEEVGGGWYKSYAVVKLDSLIEGSITELIFSIVGSNTDYKGAVLIDNLQFVKGTPPIPTEVEITSVVGLATEITGLTLNTASVKLVDSKATPVTSKLYAYLEAVGKSPYVIFGHQNDTHHKRGASYEGSTTSDTKDITGSFAGVVGLDSLSLTGAEYPGVARGLGADPVKGSAAVALNAAKEGALITLSAHFPNFDMVSKKPKVNGNWNYKDYSPNNTSGNIMQRILPEGDLNTVFTGYLDIIAQWAKLLDTQGVPVLFRPWHEHNGSWFWWGADFSSPELYKNVWRYTVEYLRDVKGVHNFLYVYSPNATFDEALYEARYPGDDYVDILAFDYYDNANGADSWLASFKRTVQLVDKLGAVHGKVTVTSETGMSTNGIVNNRRASWFTDVLDIVSESNMAYFLVWANFGGDNYMSPYKTSAARGHRMVNEFIDFYNNPKSVFADGTHFYR